MNKITVLAMLFVLIIVTAVSGCTAGNMDVSPTTTVTTNPAGAPTAATTTSPASQNTIVPSATPTSMNNVSGWTPYNVTPNPSANLSEGYVLPPWIDMHVQANQLISPEQQGPVVLVVTGNVNIPLNLTMADLYSYPQLSIVNHTYGAHHDVYQINASGASLNALLDVAQPNSTAKIVTFYGTDGYSATVLLSAIRLDPNAMIATRWNTSDDSSDAGDSTSLRNVLPNQYYAQFWVYGLVGIKVQ